MLLRSGSWGASGALCAHAGACGRGAGCPGGLSAWQPMPRGLGGGSGRGTEGERCSRGVPRASRWSRLCTRCGGARPRILERLLLCASVPPRWTGTGSVMARVRGAVAPQVRVPEVQWGVDPLPGGGKDPLLESLLIMSAPVGRRRRIRHHAWGFQMKNVRGTRRRGIPCPAPARQSSPQPGAAPVPATGWGAQAREWLGSGCLDGEGVLGVRVAVHVRRRGDGEWS